MASAQVLPSSRKQEHLEAGKRRLEEFRKKKAAERAKKAAPTNQPHAYGVNADQKQPLETEHVRLTDSDGVGTSDGPGRIAEPLGATINNGNNTIDVIGKVEQSSLKDTDPYPSSMNDYSTLYSDTMQKQTNNYDFKGYTASGFTGATDVKYGQEMDKMNNDSGIYRGSQGELSFGILSDHSVVSQGFDRSSSQFSLFGRQPLQSKENNIFVKDTAVINDGTHFLSSPPSSASFEQKTFKPSYSSSLAAVVDSTPPNTNLRESDLEVEQDKHSSMRLNYPMKSNFGERKFTNSASSLSTVHDTAVQTSRSTGFNLDPRISSSPMPPYSATSESGSRRSRPSFLDSLNVSKSSFGSSFQRTESEEESFVRNASKSNGIDVLGSSAFQNMLVESDTSTPFLELRPSSMSNLYDHSMKSSIPSSNGVGIMNSNVNESSMERQHEFYLPKPNEDFAALEQHIEDLTQEKFSLQRALEASRALLESLAAENSSLTDSYNQQRGVVNQLKVDMENLQEEIKAHLAELESVRIACANAELECNAADERAKLLASEVIGLEEKALKLRSSELKLEKQLEKSQAELNSYKKKMSSLEKDRQDLHSTIDALQEEKKLLQSKLRKASVSEKSVVVHKSPEKKDISTSTEDLDVPEATGQEAREAVFLPGSVNPDFLVLPDNGLSNIEALSVYIPPDQMRMIQNINTIISELGLEKYQLVQALASESSLCSKLKDLNNELSRKLEAQTQRLELLTAQSMANENIPARLPESRTMQDTLPTYADEGDEVVERVLGWIMKLFPGGPSRRRTSKLL